MATVYFVDTNFFLQLKEPEALPWAEIFNKPELFVMVPRTVQTELDRLKQDGNSRRSKRARKASSFLRRVVQSPNATIAVREAAPLVLIGFPPINSSSKPTPTTLDLTRSDDQIIAEVLDFSTANPSDDVFLLTSDTGPMLSARYHKVRFIAVPDNWLLDPEPDERDKTIQEFRRRLDALERAHPQIKIAAWVQEREIDAIEEQVSIFEPLSGSVIEQMMAEIGGRCPMPDDFGLSGTELTFRQTLAVAHGGYLKYTKPTADEIRKYREGDYPAWLARIRQTLMEAASRLNQRSQPFKIWFRVANNGTVPGNNTILEFRAHGEVSIHAPQKDGEPKGPVALRLPMPPSPPLGHLEEARSAASPVGFLDRHYNAIDVMPPPFRQVPPERDRYAFYWDVKSSTPTKLLRLMCDEFRHQNEAEAFELAIVLPQGKAISGAVSCRISAANLPEPV